MSEDDDLDPSAWLAAQFGEEPPKHPVVPPVAAERVPTDRQPTAAGAPPFTPPPISAPVPPESTPGAPPASDSGWPAAPAQPLPSWPVAEQPAPAFRPVPPIVPPAVPPAPVVPPPVPTFPPDESSAGQAPAGGFAWGLTPRAESTVPTAPEPAPEPAQVPPPAVPWETAVPPAVAQPATPVPAVDQPTIALPAFDQPTTAFSALDQPTAAFPAFGQQPGVPGQGLEPLPADPAQWLAAPLDPALEGATEVFEAELVGLGGPQGENVPASDIDDLFGDGQFREFADGPLLPVPPLRQGGGGRGGDTSRPPRAPRAPIPRTQKILMMIAGGLVAVLALVALYAAGTKIASLIPAPAIAVSASPTPSATPGPRPVGPVAPGDYHWDQLLGGECLKPFQSAWEDTYTVVDCTAPHPAQLVFRGTFTDPASATYPGLAELQKRMTLLCTPATIINYGVAGAIQDIQVQASFAPEESDWDNGNHDYYCFVNRSGGGDLTASVAIPQVAASPAAPAKP
ncbi:hypothetical protein BH11ACT4_BH11ACT4_07210 [soil metagenome]